jgi:hypothetical protein
VALVAVALTIVATAVVAPAAGAGTAPTVSIQPASGPIGQVIQVQASFPGACSQGIAVLDNPSSGNLVSLSGPFTVNAAGDGTTTLTVPSGAQPGQYEVIAGCMSPVGDESAAVPFEVTGSGVAASVSINPTKGFAGTGITVSLTITPAGSPCGLPAIALRSAPVQNNASALVDVELGLTPPAAPGGAYQGTLTVPGLAAPGKIYYVDGGCAGTNIVSPYKTFLVIAQNHVAKPSWWKFFSTSFDAGTEGLLLTLASGPTYPFVPIAPTTTTTTPRAAPTPEPTPGSTGTSTTTTTCPPRRCDP